MLRDSPALQELARLKDLETTRKFSKLMGLVTCAQCSSQFDKSKNGPAACSFHPGKLQIFPGKREESDHDPGAQRKYEHNYCSKSIK